MNILVTGGAGFIGSHIVDQLTNTTITRQYREAKLGEQQHSCLSYDKIHQAISWQPQTNLQQGLLQTVEYFKSNLQNE